MTLRAAQVTSLVLCTLSIGLMAGLFAAFSYAVMPGLRRTDDRTFVEAMKAVNAAILNGWFMVLFLGSLVFAVLALVLHIPSGRSALPWIAAGLALYVIQLMITGGVNVPLNNELAEFGTPGGTTDPAAARAAFESRWVAWNIVRALVVCAAFAAFTWALVVHARASADRPDPARAAQAYYQKHVTHPVHRPSSW